MADEWTIEREAEAWERCKKATPGPWRWWWPFRGIPSLVHPLMSRLTVLDAQRSGMQGAVVRFASRTTKDMGGIMRPATALLDEPAMRDSEWPDVPNPDMAFIAKARADLPAAISEIRRLRAEVERLTN